MDAKTGWEHWVTDLLFNNPPESCGERRPSVRQCDNSEPPSSAYTPTHTGTQLQLVEGTLVIVAEAIIQHNGAVSQDAEEIDAVSSAGDDLCRGHLGEVPATSLLLLL